MSLGANPAWTLCLKLLWQYIACCNWTFPPVTHHPKHNTITTTPWALWLLWSTRMTDTVLHCCKHRWHQPICDIYNVRCAEIRSQASYLPNSKADNGWPTSCNSKIVIMYCMAFWEVTCLRALRYWWFKIAPGTKSRKAKSMPALAAMLQMHGREKSICMNIWYVYVCVYRYSAKHKMPTDRPLEQQNQSIKSNQLRKHCDRQKHLKIPTGSTPGQSKTLNW